MATTRLTTTTVRNRSCSRPGHRRILGPCCFAGTRPWSPKPKRFPAAPIRRWRFPRPTSSTATRLTGPWPDGIEIAVVRHGVLLGCRAQVLDSSTVCTPPSSATPAGTRRTPRTKRSAPVGPVTPRSSASSSTRSVISYEQTAEDVLGEPRPDAGHAAGQRRRQPVPQCDLRHRRRSSAPPSRRSRASFQERLTAAGLRRDHHRDRPIDRENDFYYAEPYHQQYLAKNPNGYCGVGGTGVSCPIGISS